MNEYGGWVSPKGEERRSDGYHTREVEAAKILEGDNVYAIKEWGSFKSQLLRRGYMLVDVLSREIEIIHVTPLTPKQIKFVAELHGESKKKIVLKWEEDE